MFKGMKLNRFKGFALLLSVLAVLVLLQMVRIQNSVAAQDLTVQIGKERNYDIRTIQPERGSIYDRWGHLLAGSRQVYDIGVARDQVNDAETISNVLASLLDMNSLEIQTKLTTAPIEETGEYVTIATNISADVITKLSEIIKKYEDAPAQKDGSHPNLTGVHYLGHLLRTYPENDLASNVLGYFPFLYTVDENGREAIGEGGVEEKYDELLRGTPVKLAIPLDPKEIETIPTVPPGDSLVLTIDREIQDMVERLLDEHVENSGSDSGTAIVMDPETGEILAMASTPRLNLNEYFDAANIFQGNTPYNRAISQTYEPGSVFKVLTMAAALDAGVVTPETTFIDTGAIDINGVYFYNWDRNAYGEVNMTECMQHSLNVCLTWIAKERLKPTLFYQYVQAFGIGHRTNIDLADEQIFPLSLPGDENWNMVNLGTNSFGQGISATPIQMITAISSVANDGNMMAPHIVKAVIKDGEVQEVRPMVIGTPITSDTAHTLTEMLAVSLEEESSSALVEGYRVSGKTGTGEVPTENGYSLNATNASFVGWGPSDDPKFIVYVWLEKPESSPWGSVVASPLFSDIVKELVVMMNLPPDEIRKQIR